MKDLRLFCYGEQTYGSGSKGSEQEYLKEKYVLTVLDVQL